jgi:hypothetical protein
MCRRLNKPVAVIFFFVELPDIPITTKQALFFNTTTRIPRTPRFCLGLSIQKLIVTQSS